VRVVVGGSRYRIPVLADNLSRDGHGQNSQAFVKEARTSKPSQAGRSLASWDECRRGPQAQAPFSPVEFPMPISFDWKITPQVFVALAGIVVSFLLGLQMRERVGNIEAAQSTQFVGQFPHYTEELLDALSGAREKITIMCDYPAYGAFSDPEGFLKYRQMLESKLQDDVEITIVCFDEQQRTTVAKNQFRPAGSTAPDEDWEKTKGDPQFRKKLERYLAIQSAKEPPGEIGLERFIEILEDEDKRTLQLMPLAKKREVNAYVPLFFWIIDDEKAIFSIPDFPAEGKSTGFATKDPKLLQALAGVAERFLNHPLPPSAVPETAPARHVRDGK